MRWFRSKPREVLVTRYRILDRTTLMPVPFVAGTAPSVTVARGYVIACGEDPEQYLYAPVECWILEEK